MSLVVFVFIVPALIVHAVALSIASETPLPGLGAGSGLAVLAGGFLSISMYLLEGIGAVNAAPIEERNALMEAALFGAQYTLWAVFLSLNGIVVLSLLTLSRSRKAGLNVFSRNGTFLWIGAILLSLLVIPPALKIMNLLSMGEPIHAALFTETLYTLSSRSRFVAPIGGVFVVVALLSGLGLIGGDKR
ncbi:MAG TPA: hypothetical protein ENK18_11210 [Deltaproteobacteria bacterium]|nr:hypothetical protein [Deltaproteobacteria bacterium]